MALFPTGNILAGSWSDTLSIGVLKAEMSFYDASDPRAGGYFGGEKVPFTELESVEIATEETVQKFSSALGAGLVGMALLGPLGLLAGVALKNGGKSKQVTFILKLRDGRQALIVGEERTYTSLHTALLREKMGGHSVTATAPQLPQPAAVPTPSPAPRLAAPARQINSWSDYTKVEQWVMISSVVVLLVMLVWWIL